MRIFAILIFFFISGCATKREIKKLEKYSLLQMEAIRDIKLNILVLEGELTKKEYNSLKKDYAEIKEMSKRCVKKTNKKFENEILGIMSFPSSIFIEDAN